MGNFFEDNADLKFYMDKGIDWATLYKLAEPDLKHPDAPQTAAEAKETYRDTLSMVGEFIAEQVAPKVPGIEKAGLSFKDGKVIFPPALDEIFAKIKELGIHGLSIPRSLGGSGAPVTLYFLAAELLGRADVSMMTHNSFHSLIAMSLMLYSIDEGSTQFDPKTGAVLKTRFDKEMAEIISGNAWGSMDITEPNAGSDMGALGTRAEQDAQGNWLITGQKIFITSGHGKYHIVIARTEKEGTDAKNGGLGGLSLFLVPMFETQADGTITEHAKVDRIEEKLGHHSSPTCAITFEKSPGQLLGKRGEGFKGMLLLMNNARVGVGFESLGLCEAAYRLAKGYASERRSMGKTLDKHEMVQEMLDEMHTDIQALRAMCIYAAYHEEIAVRMRMLDAANIGSDLDKQKRKQLGRKMSARSRRVTPLLKHFGAEKAVEMARKCLQIHGGAGYTTEYGAEKLLRDSLVLPIYEGTTQIQALMAMKDTLGAVMKDPQRFLKRSAQAKWRMTSSRDVLERRVAGIQSMSLTGIRKLLGRTVAEKLRGLSGHPVTAWSKLLKQSWDPKRDFAFAMLHADRLTKLLTDASLCEILLKQAQEFPERREVLERYLERAEPRCRHMIDEISCMGERIVKMLHPDIGHSADEVTRSA